MSKTLVASLSSFSIWSLFNKKSFLIVPLLCSAAAYADCPMPNRIDVLQSGRPSDKTVYLVGLDDVNNLWESRSIVGESIVDIRRDFAVVNAEDPTKFSCAYKATIVSGATRKLNETIRLETVLEKVAVIDLDDGPWSDVVPPGGRPSYFCAFLSPTHMCKFTLESLSHGTSKWPFSRK